MKTQYAVVIHFDSPAGLLYPHPQCPGIAERRERTTTQPAWWEARYDLLSQFVLPALGRQTFQDFRVWALINWEDLPLARETANLFLQQKLLVGFYGPSSLWGYYAKEDFDWLVLIHLDSDDLYGPEALEVIASREVRAGQVYYFEKGFAFDFDTGTIAEYNPDPVTPPPFNAVVYPKEALRNLGWWYRYRNRWRLNFFHHDIKGAERHAALPGRHYCVLLHGTNTTSVSGAAHIQRNIGEILGGESRELMLKQFGLREVADDGK